MATISVILLCFLVVGCVSGIGYRRPRPPILRDICQLPKVEGPCEAFVPSWFYNSLTRKCEYFIYGGCQGNENRFETKEACERRCGRPQSERCGNVYCKADEVCRKERPICFNPRAYCPTTATCVKDCSAVSCVAPGPGCSSVPVPGECCPLVKCDEPAPLPTCEGHHCPPGQVCRLEQPQCVRAPCPPIPQCVTQQKCSGPGQECECSNDYDCPRGEECKFSPIQCIRAPCPEGISICVSRQVREKPGFCPPPSGLITTCEFKPGRNCLSDTECLGQKKCCREGCGKECKYPVLHIPQQGILA